MTQSTLPIFLKVSGKPALVVGGGEVAWRKVLWLSASGVRVEALAPSFVEPLETLTREQPERLTLIRREYAPMDLSAYLVVIAATDRGDVNRAVAEDARRTGVPVNVVDQPELCDFYVPATVRRGDLCIAIGTGGSCPPLAAQIRRDLEARYPEALGMLAGALGRVRQWLIEEGVEYEDRRRVLDSLCEESLAGDWTGLDAGAIEERLSVRTKALIKEQDVKKNKKGLDTEAQYQ